MRQEHLRGHLFHGNQFEVGVLLDLCLELIRRGRQEGGDVVYSIRNHRGSNLVAALLRVGAGDVGRHNNGEILFRRKPHYHIPHRIRAIVHQCVSASPVPFTTIQPQA